MREVSDILVVFIFVANNFSPSASTQCGKTCRLLNRKLVGHVISSQISDDTHSCMELCIDHQQCYSINYHLNERQCELNDRTRLSNPVHVIPAAHVIHQDNPARDYVACSDMLCYKMQVCHVTEGMPTCIACDTAFGMESGLLVNSAFTASSVWGNSLHEPFQARLHNQATAGVGVGCWAAARLDAGEWLQVDLGETKVVTKVATQGRPLMDQWVKSYKITFSRDAANWETFKENGVEKVFLANSDRNTVVSHALYPQPRAQHVRIVAQTWRDYIALRAELYGCTQL